MSTAKFKFPSAIALVHLMAYGKCPDAARTRAIILRVITNVNSFLVSGAGSRIRNTSGRYDRHRPVCVEPQCPQNPFGHLLWRWLGWGSVADRDRDNLGRYDDRWIDLLLIEGYHLFVNQFESGNGSRTGMNVLGTPLGLIIGIGSVFWRR